MTQNSSQPKDQSGPSDAGTAPSPAAYRPARSRLLRGVLLGIGWLSVGLGVLGIVLPLLPTTPFLLLAAACFLRSSSEFHAWLVGHPHLGKYLEYYLGNSGMPFRAKVYTISLLWTTMALSAWLVSKPWVTIMLLITGLAVSIHIGRMPTRESTPRS